MNYYLVRNRLGEYGVVDENNQPQGFPVQCHGGVFTKEWVDSKASAESGLAVLKGAAEHAAKRNTWERVE